MKNAIIIILLSFTAWAVDAQTTSAAKKDTIKVEIWSDVVCPFCYMGKRNFDKALSDFSHKDQVVIVWHSYQLNTEAQKEYKGDIYDLISQKFGQTRQWAIDMCKHMQKEAAAVGLTYNYDSMKPTNTFDAHRLIKLAAIHGLQDKAEEALFHAYFTDGKNISDAATLTQIGTSIGLNEAEVKTMLAGTNFADKVHADELAAEKLRIGGVPYFIVNGKYKVDGAQPSETFLKTLDKAWGKLN